MRIPGDAVTRIQELKRLWKPVGTLVSVLSAFAAIVEFYRQVGPFIYISLGFLVLAVAILFTIPVSAIRLFALRVVAFLLDLVFLGLFTFAVVGFLFRIDLIQPSAVVSMVVVWSWFLYFVVFDSICKGTPGKLILGLRFTRVGEDKVTLSRSLAQNFLTVVVPIVGVSWLTDFVDPGRSELRFLTTSPICDGLLFLFPLSIAFLGGQSVPDLLVGTTVLPRRFVPAQYLARTNWRTWFFLSTFSLLMGLLFSLAWFMGIGRITFEKMPPASPPALETYGSSEEDARLAARLWTVLPVAFRHPDELIQRVEVVSYERNDFTGSSEVLSPMPYEEALKAQEHMRIVRLEMTGHASSLVKLALLENLIAFASPNASSRERPVFLVLEFSESEDFGVFTLRISENNLLCLMESGGSAVDFYVLPSPSGSVRMFGSIDELRFLFLGDLRTYAAIENLPIWPR
jgi:RDD family protein